MFKKRENAVTKFENSVSKDNQAKMLVPFSLFTLHSTSLNFSKQVFRCGIPGKVFCIKCSVTFENSCRVMILKQWTINVSLILSINNQPASLVSKRGDRNNQHIAYFKKVKHTLARRALFQLFPLRLESASSTYIHGTCVNVLFVFID